MATLTDVCNMALMHLGITKTIANVTSERSIEAASCRVFLDTARKQVLRDHPWPFATKHAVLGLVSENPSTEWGYAYQYPPGAVAIRRLVSGLRNDNRQSRAAFREESSSSGGEIHADLQHAVVEYTADVTNPDHFPPDFMMALSLRLAVYIAPAVTGGDPFKLGDRAVGLYRQEIGYALTNAFNESQGDEEPESEFIRARG